MRSTKFLATAAAWTLGVVAVACGGGGDDRSSVAPSTPTTVSASASTERAPAPATSTTAPYSALPTTLVLPDPRPTNGPITGDLLDAATWIGHVYAEQTVADPFQHVELDGVVTDFIAFRYGAIPGPEMPSGFAGFARPDPGGYGHSGMEAGPWVVLAWWPSDLMSWTSGGPVYDALVTTTVANEMPVVSCTAIDGSAGTHLGFVAYDPGHRPTPGDREAAPFPVTRAWRITEDIRLEAVPPETVTCSVYEFGD